MNKTTLKAVFSFSLLIILSGLFLGFCGYANWLELNPIAGVPLEAWILIGGLILAVYIKGWSLYYDSKETLTELKERKELSENEVEERALVQVKKNMRIGVVTALLTHAIIVVATFGILHSFVGMTPAAIVGSAVALLATLARPISEQMSYRLRINARFRENSMEPKARRAMEVQIEQLDRRCREALEKMAETNKANEETTKKLEKQELLNQQMIKEVASLLEEGIQRIESLGDSAEFKKICDSVVAYLRTGVMPEDSNRRKKQKNEKNK